MRSPNHPGCSSLLWCLLAVTTGGPFLSPALGTDYVRASGPGFKVCDQDIRFVGFNLERICHYGHGDILPFSQTSDIATNLNFCVTNKATVIRTFCAYHGIGQVATGDRLQTILDACQTRSIRVIVAFTDMYTTNLSPQGDDVYYTNGLLNHTFFQSGYTNNYLPQALYLANRFKDHPAVFAWQIGNELRDSGNAATFVTFCQNVAAQIRATDPNHMVNPGMIGYRFCGLTLSQATQLYSSMDFVGTHNYNGSDSDNDSDVAGQLNKPYVIDEAGFAYSVYGPDRTPETNADIQKWLGRGADGYMNWGLMATSNDNGDGDQVFGIDSVFHNSDYSLYQTLYHNWGASFQLPATVGVSPGQIQRTVKMGTVPTDDTFSVVNLGTGSFTFQASESSSWFSITPSSGSAACTGTPITIHYDTSALPPGTHTSAIQIVSAGTAGSPQSVQVSVTVSPPPGDADSDGDVDQSDFGRFQICLKGPAVAQNDPSCAWAKLNADIYVDNNDFNLLLQCMGGANVLANPDCAQ